MRPPFDSRAKALEGWPREPAATQLTIFGILGRHMRSTRGEPQPFGYSGCTMPQFDGDGALPIRVEGTLTDPPPYGVNYDPAWRKRAGVLASIAGPQPAKISKILIGDSRCRDRRGGFEAPG